jgi:hypothetical protein
MERYVIEVCNTCGGLVGWQSHRDGCCPGGVVCRRPDGTRFLSVRPTGERVDDDELPYERKRKLAPAPPLTPPPLTPHLPPRGCGSLRERIRSVDNG